ncbi:hypothetical protein EV363DRAFT_1220998 [Boletus edulis]|nr:hypothetical protein EV363DRAFT_1220998 [Boletus edulis]
MVTLPLQSVSAESGENSSQNSPGQRSQESIAFLLLKVAFSVRLQSSLIDFSLVF